MYSNQQADTKRSLQNLWRGDLGTKRFAMQLKELTAVDRFNATMAYFNQGQRWGRAEWGGVQKRRMLSELC